MKTKLNHRKPFKLGVRWKEPIGLPFCPYMHRWILNLGIFSIRVHHWERSDDKRAFHNHPWHFLTLVLKGGYTDVTPDGKGGEKKEKLSFLSCKIRKACHNHYVKVEEGGCWSLLLTTSLKFKWGFMTPDGKKFPKNKYFKKYGHPPCDDQ